MFMGRQRPSASTINQSETKYTRPTSYAHVQPAGVVVNICISLKKLPKTQEQEALAAELLDYIIFVTLEWTRALRPF
jgi:hypothetical protein